MLTSVVRGAWEYDAELGHVIDADTLELTVILAEGDLGFRQRVRITHTDQFRLAGLDAPELRTPEGKAARAWVVEWLNTYAEVDPGGAVARVVVQTQKDRREKYGRMLATVYSPAVPEPQCLNLDLIAAGHAVPYEGGKRGALPHG
jgi:endonuclease YncB( thermonuclease family)